MGKLTYGLLKFLDPDHLNWAQKQNSNQYGSVTATVHFVPSNILVYIKHFNVIFPPHKGPQGSAHKMFEELKTTLKLF